MILVLLDLAKCMILELFKVVLTRRLRRPPALREKRGA
jgi:hypothetical protein